MPLPHAAPSRRAAPPPAMPSLEAQAAGLDLDRCVLRRRLLHLEAGLAFLHLQPDEVALGEALGLAPGSDLARHFAEVVALRLLEALRDPSHKVGLAAGGWVGGQASGQGAGLGLEAALEAARRVSDQPSPQGAGLDAGVSLHPERLAAGGAPALRRDSLVAELPLLGGAPGASAPTGADWAALRSAGWNAEIRLLMDSPRDPSRLSGPTPVGPAEVPLLVELPARAVLAGTLPRGLAARHVAALPLSSATDPGAFADLAALADLAGWGVALCGLTANTLAWLRPQPVTADWFILQWSEALRDGAALDSLHRLDPDRIILTGCDTDAAVEWGQSLPIRVFGGAATSLSAPPKGVIA